MRVTSDWPTGEQATIGQALGDAYNRSIIVQKPSTCSEIMTVANAALCLPKRRRLRRLSDAAHLVEGIVLVPWVDERPGRIHELGL